MGLDQIAVVLLGALAGGFVNGLTGFGTAITAMGLWLYAIPPATAASLAIVCSVISQVQTLPMIWRVIDWPRILPFVVPGVLGVPVGTWLLAQIDPRTFKIVIGLFLVSYSGYVLARRSPLAGSQIGGRAGDNAVGFGGGILGGLAGLSGVLPVVWTDIRGWSKDQRRMVLQTFNLSILAVALLSHAASGFLTPQVGWATAAALPRTIVGSWAGAFVYRRLSDNGFQRIVMALIFASGAMLIATSW
jgi:uncharacterized membrane protein YfcA